MRRTKESTEDGDAKACRSDGNPSLRVINLFPLVKSFCRGVRFGYVLLPTDKPFSQDTDVTNDDEDHGFANSDTDDVSCEKFSLFLRIQETVGCEAGDKIRTRNREFMIRAGTKKANVRYQPWVA